VTPSATRVVAGAPRERLIKDFHMRCSPPLLFALLCVACGREKRPDTVGFFTLHPGEVQRKMGCNVILDEVRDRDATLRYMCRVPSPAMNEGRWWAGQSPPPAFTMKVGDCLLLEMFYYCAEEIVPGKSLSLRSTYTTQSNSGDVIKRDREK
jgi:hypothetical protein